MSLTRSPLGLLAALGVLAPLSVAAVAAPPKKPVAPKPPAVKPAAPKSNTVVLGTTQLPGDFGKLGQTYTIGDPQARSINFTLDRAEFSVRPFVIAGTNIVPKADEKLLVLHFTVHNPLPEEQSYDWSGIHFTAVDAKDVNHENEQYVVREGTTEDSLSVNLKPAQKIAVQTVIVVPAAGVVPKLIVKRDDNSAVIRYDLRGKVSPVPAPVADPADATGATARREVPSPAGTLQPLGPLEARVDGLTFAKEKLGDIEPEEGKRFAVVAVTLRNPVASALQYDWNTLAPELTDAAGDKYEYNQVMLKAAQNTLSEGGTLRPGEEVRVRYFFAVPEAAQPKTLRLSFGGEEGRAFLFDVSGAVK